MKVRDEQLQVVFVSCNCCQRQIHIIHFFCHVICTFMKTRKNKHDTFFSVLWNYIKQQMLIIQMLHIWFKWYSINFRTWVLRSKVHVCVIEGVLIYHVNWCVLIHIICIDAYNTVCALFIVALLLIHYNLINLSYSCK